MGMPKGTLYYPFTEGCVLALCVLTAQKPPLADDVWHVDTLPGHDGEGGDGELALSCERESVYGDERRYMVLSPNEKAELLRVLATGEAQ